MAKLLRTLPLLGLTFLVGALIFFPSSTVHAQAATPTTNSAAIKSLDNSGIISTLSSCISQVDSSVVNLNNSDKILDAFWAKQSTLSDFNPVPSEKCRSHIPVDNKPYTTTCSAGGLNATSLTGNCTIRASDGSYYYITRNDVTQGGYKYEAYDSKDTRIGTSNTASGLVASVLTSVDSFLEGSAPVGETGVNAGKNIAGSAETCGVFDIWGCFLNFLFSIIAKIASFILLLIGGLLYLANYLLGWSTYITVYQFGNLIGNSEGLIAAWNVLRDVANIVLLFGFIFMGISTILNLSHSEYTAKRALPTLIIFALLMNFSLLASEAVIDVSNATAVSIYSQASGCGAGEQISCITDKGIGGAIMSLSGATTAYKDFITDGIGKGASDAVIIIGLSIFLLITTLVIFAAAIMLIIRAVILGLLMVTSPIGFAGMAIPPLHNVATTWWKQLMSQAFFAPVYFLIVFVCLKMMQGIVTALVPSKSVTGASLASVFQYQSSTGGASSISIGVTFALLIGFMIAALMFAKKSSAIGTGFAVKSAGALAFGTLGYVGRNTVGKSAYRVGRSIQNSNFGGTRLGQFTAQRFQGVGKASFDVRGAGVGAVLAGRVGNLGTPTKGGYDAAVHSRTEAQKKYAEGRGNSDKEREQMIELSRTNARIADKVTAAKEEAVLEVVRIGKEISKEEEKVAIALTALAPEEAGLEAKQTELESEKTNAKTLRDKEKELRSKGYLDQADTMNEKATVAEQKVLTLQTQYDADEKNLSVKKVAITQDLDTLKADKIAQQKIAEGKDDRSRNFNTMVSNNTAKKGEIFAKGKDRKREYAQNLHRSSVFGIGSGNTGDHHAAMDILEASYKSEEALLLSNLNKLLKAESKDSPKPAPATSDEKKTDDGVH